MDNSLRGRLRRLLEKVKKFREKKVDVEPEPQEDKKPSERFHPLHDMTPYGTNTVAKTVLVSVLHRLNLFYWSKSL